MLLMFLPFSPLAAAVPARAQTLCPSGLAAITVPYAAGGSSNVIARVVSEELGRVLGQRVAHENMVGPTARRVAKARPDGRAGGAFDIPRATQSKRANFTAVF